MTMFHRLHLWLFMFGLFEADLTWERSVLKFGWLVFGRGGRPERFDRFPIAGGGGGSLKNGCWLSQAGLGSNVPTLGSGAANRLFPVTPMGLPTFSHVSLMLQTAFSHVFPLGST